MSKLGSVDLRPAAWVAMLVGSVLLGYGTARGAPAEDPNCMNHMCNEVYFIYECSPLDRGVNYLHADCLRCASASGRCADYHEMGPDNCQASELFNQWLAVVSVSNHCNCQTGVSYVEAEGTTATSFTETQIPVYNCPSS